MRALFSYGLAFVLLLLAGGWLATGTLVQGGQGPGNGETPIISVIEGEEHGPVATALADAGVLADHHEPAVDPTLTIAQRNEATTGANAPLQSVRTQRFVAEAMPIEVPLRGRTQAKATVTAVAETAGAVDVVHVSKGQRVEVGDALCTLDQGTRAAAVAQAEAGVAQAEAALAQAQLSFDTNAGLRERGLAAVNTANAVEVALAQAKAGVSQATAALDNAKAELDRTEIVAKVAGLVQDPVATEGAMLNAGSPCATIVQLNPILFIGMVPEAHIGLARTGLDATIKTVTGQSVEGTVTYISSVADNATRAFPAEIEIPNENFAIRDGVTAEAIVTIGSAPGHLLPQSVLTLNDEGVLGVRTVEDGVVAFHSVTIVSDAREGVWVTGLPAISDVITIGQENVNAGQAVEASPAAETAAS
ncbi:efflux RND transporter periplasmic adaptor subunit [Devosia sp. XJ19-1]|uniref:Efflux RND transporter periplasmic adaptor subunit n=1 Tax=Devosia ureilytica TaxID=2952754 RepID=A0A9Q4AQD1_9HYPH|nr:efflux RND transporter periplasmic adaptor subunit [Devosia ureilytica]MCP8884183.1 efflux RND transporter periplasmic adaptor subunit [Devosia ureilytica]MCP8887791.1 efflux RND transporter periplasmic adaptor subunit [Devosia ureilytica]